MRYPEARIRIKDYGNIIIRLRPDCAPNTVNSFIYLASEGIYKGHIIERIVPGYVIDASYHAFHDDRAKYLIENESRKHGSSDHIIPGFGTICMGGYDGLISGGEFFFPLSLSEKINGYYPAFGIINSGLDIIRQIEAVPTEKVIHDLGKGIEIYAPRDDIIIEDVILDLNGYVSQEPVIISDAALPSNWK